MEDELKEACEGFLARRLTVTTFKNELRTILHNASLEDLKSFAELVLVGLEDETEH